MLAQAIFLRGIIFAVFGLFVAVSTSNAVPVYGTAADLSGSRSIGSGLTGTGNYADSDVTIAWDIVQNLNGSFTYTYTLTGFEGIQGGGVSHLTLDISDNFSDDIVTEATLNGESLDGSVEFGDFNEPAQAGPYLITGGVKFNQGGDEGPLVYSFISFRVPVWQNGFIKGGGGLAPGNNAFTNGILNPTSENVLDFIATPDSVGSTDVPEPATMLLFSTGLLMAGAVRKRR